MTITAINAPTVVGGERLERYGDVVLPEPPAPRRRSSNFINMDDPTITDTGATAADRCCGGATHWIERAAAEALATRLGAVADPVRLQVLSIIANAPSGEVCACDFVEPLGKSQPTVSHHLKVLAEAGLVEGDKRGRWIWYRLGKDAVGSLAGALGGVVSDTGTQD